MKVILYYLAQEYSLVLSAIGLSLSVMAFIIPRVNSRRNQENSSYKGAKRSYRLLTIADKVCLIIALLSGLSIANYLFFKYVQDIEMVRVPYVIDLTYENASMLLRTAELREKAISDDNSNDLSNYIVIEQAPDAGEIVQTNTEIELTVAAPQESDEPMLFDIFVDPTAQQLGRVSVSPTRAVSGETVTLTIKADENVFLEFRIMDSDENEITQTQIDENISTFIMPGRAVNVQLLNAIISPPDSVCSYEPDCPTRSFTDLDPNSWYHEAVDFVIKEGLLTGYSDNTFNPDGTLSRAAMAHIFYIMAGRPETHNIWLFNDVEYNSWYIDSMNWSVDNGIINGYSDKTFRPDDIVTKEQFITMLWRYGGLPSAKPYPYFDDMAQISEYAISAVEWAAERGLISDSGDKRLYPKNFITRVQVAQVLIKFFSSR